jgi:hypothetical protein
MDFSITAMHKDCLSRQIGEALRINYSKDVILNSKGEYLSNTISRLTIEEVARDKLDKENVEIFKRMKTSSQKEEQVEENEDLQTRLASSHGGEPGTQPFQEDENLPNTGGPCHQYGGGGAPPTNKYPGKWPIQPPGQY